MHRRPFSAVFISAAAAVAMTVPLGTAAEAVEPVGSPSSTPFGPQSVWRTPLDTAPIDVNSQTMVDYLMSTITDRYSGVAAFNAHQYNSHLYTVDGTTPTTDFAFDDCQGKHYVPSGLVGPDGQFKSVPVPSDAVAATGSDAELSIYSSATDQLWEFWKARKRADGTWSACWGGRLDHVSTSAGFFAGNYGATATSLPNAGGLVRLSEIRAGRIGHMMSLAIPKPANWSNFRWPAQRSDGSDTSAAALPEGSRLRLDPSIDLSSYRLSPAALTIARAAQEYGFVVVDKSGAVSVLAEAVGKDASGRDPWYQALGSPDYAVMKNFPWSRLQVVADGWRGPATGAVAASAGSTATASNAAATSVPAASASGASSASEASHTTTPAAPAVGSSARASTTTPPTTAGTSGASNGAAAAAQAAEKQAAAKKAAANKAAGRKNAPRESTRHWKAAKHEPVKHKTAHKKAATRKGAHHSTKSHKTAHRKITAHESAHREATAHPTTHPTRTRRSATGQ